MTISVIVPPDIVRPEVVTKPKTGWPEIGSFIQPYQSVVEAMHAKVKQGGVEDAFFVADLASVVRQYAQWRAELPRIEPFYAVKCNPDPVVVALLAELGANFDCASKEEIRRVIATGTPNAASRIIYANPCKAASHLRFAAESGVQMMTFDNADELHKIKKHHPTAGLLLRIITDDSKSLCQFGLKFGAHLDRIKPLLSLAKELELNILGISFHVGSGCGDAMAFDDAVRRARYAFDMAAEVGLPPLSMLDIGGGFPGQLVRSGPSFPQIAAVLRSAIDRYFSPAENPLFAPEHLRIIAEPGRYFVTSAFYIAVNVIARRVVENPADGSRSFMYYVNDGVYGSFNCTMFDHQTVYPGILSRDGDFASVDPLSINPVDGSAPTASTEEMGGSLFASSIWGPTCDGIDCITRTAQLPECQPGDWLYFREMGAYTKCAASEFNGFALSKVVYIDTDAAASGLTLRGRSVAAGIEQN